jgi:hypothetical protein
VAELRCDELTKAGDTAGTASWKRILKIVQKLAAGNPQQRGTIN